MQIPEIHKVYIPNMILIFLQHLIKGSFSSWNPENDSFLTFSKIFSCFFSYLPIY